MSEAFAEGTKANLESQWKRFNEFCEYFDVEMKMPTLHILNGVAIDGFDDITVKLALRGAARRLSHTPKQAQPITPRMLFKFRNLLDLSTPADSTYWALFLMTFFMFMRKSNMVPVSLESFDPKKQLTRGDVREKDGVLLIHGKWSKTNQCGTRSGGIPLLSMEYHPTDIGDLMDEIAAKNRKALILVSAVLYRPKDQNRTSRSICQTNEGLFQLCRKRGNAVMIKSHSVFKIGNVVQWKY